MRSGSVRNVETKQFPDLIQVWELVKSDHSDFRVFTQDGIIWIYETSYTLAARMCWYSKIDTPMIQSSRDS